jgi:hypothetical protein
MKRLLAFLILTLLSCGCATVDSSCAGGKHLLSIKNSGWRLFTLIPLASGDVHHPNINSTRFFQDTTSLENNITMLDNEVKKAGARGFKNLSSTIREENVLFILLSRRIYHTSAELVFDGALAE